MTILRGRPFSPVESQMDLMRSHVTRGVPVATRTDGGRTPRMAVPAGWTREARCLGDYSFDETHGMKAGQAAQLCEGCPVLAQCLAAALVEEHGLSAGSRYGVRGGLSPKERAALDDEAGSRRLPIVRANVDPKRSERVRAARAARRACCVLCKAEVVAENLPRHYAQNHEEGVAA